MTATGNHALVARPEGLAATLDPALQSLGATPASGSAAEDADLAIVDLAEGRAAGFALMSRAEVAIIAITDADDEAGRAEALRLGARNVFARPLTPDALLRAVETSLAMVRLRVENRRLAALAAECGGGPVRDPLTGLANRDGFMEELRRGVARARSGARVTGALLINFKGFSEVNDLHGLTAGDRVLETAARRLRGAARRSDAVARLAADEFALALVDVGSADDARRLAERVHRRLTSPIQVENGRVALAVSVGLALSPNDAATSDDLFRRASVALFAARRAGGGVRLFDTELEGRLSRQRREDREMRDALAHGEFELHYQPIMALGPGVPTAAEALIRWRHPARGLVPPLDFIPAAERSGLIVEIGYWVLDRALRDLAAWRRRGLALKRISVNLSPRQLRDENLAARVSACLAAAGLNPGDLELELTESLAMDDGESCASRLDALRETGLSLAIDDFGAGHSSMARLRNHSFHRLKIDRSFVRNLPADRGDRAICEAAIGLARAFDMAVVAEGVEDGEQAAFLRDRGCDEAQGYHFMKPAPAAEFAHWLSGRGSAAA